MPITVIKSGDFKTNPTRAKKAAGTAPVIVTEYGKPAYVILSIDAYRQLIADSESPTAFKDISVDFSYLFGTPLLPSKPK